MEAARKGLKRVRPEEDGFDIVIQRVIGRVEHDPTATDTIMESAFRTIGASGEEGTFQFHVPARMLNSGQADGFTATVKVDYQSDKPA